MAKPTDKSAKPPVVATSLAVTITEPLNDDNEMPPLYVKGALTPPIPRGSGTMSVFASIAGEKAGHQYSGSAVVSKDERSWSYQHSVSSNETYTIVALATCNGKISTSTKVRIVA